MSPAENSRIGVSMNWSVKERTKKVTSDAGVADVDVRGLGRVLEDGNDA